MSNVTNILNDTSLIICRNSYSERVYLSDEAKTILLIVMVTVMVLSLIANSSVIFGLVTSHQTKNISTRLILYLTVSDWCLTVFGLPLYILLFTDHYRNSACKLETGVEFFAILFAHISAYIIGIIGYDRYFRMHYLNSYSEVVKSWKLQFSVGVCITLSFLQTSVQVIGIQYNFFLKATGIGLVIDLLIVVFILLPYILSIRTVKKHRRHALNRALLNNVDRVITSSATRIMIAVVVLYTPYIIFCIVRWFVSYQSGLVRNKWFTFGLFFSYFLALSNSFVNSIILLNINSKCQRKVVELLQSIGNVLCVGKLKRKPSRRVDCLELGGEEETNAILENNV